MSRTNSTASSRSYFLLLIGILTTLGSSLTDALPRQDASARGSGHQLHMKVKSAHTTAPTPQSMYAPIADLPDSSGAELVLNNRSPHDMDVAPVLYTRNGTALPVRTLTLTPLEIRYVAIQDLIPVDYHGQKKMGGIGLSYLGEMMEVAAQLTLLGHAGAGSVDIPFSGIMDYRSTVQEAVWWMPGKGVATIILGNASDKPIEAHLKYSFGQTENVQLGPFATEVIDYRRDAPSSGANLNGSADSVTIEAAGAVGSLRASGFVRSNDKKFTSAIRFYDSQTIRQQHLFATNLRLKNNVPRMVLKNTGGIPISAVPRFLPTSGETGAAVELPAQALGPFQAIEVNLQALTNAAGKRPDLDVVSVQVLNGGSTGSLIGALCSSDQITQTTYDVPLRDSGPVRNSTGNYPWRLDGDYSTIVTITNVGTEPAFFTVTMSYEGGKYLPPPRQLAVGETALFNLNQIRNEQIPDKDGRILPDGAKIGQFHWSVLRGGGPVRLIGRGEMVSLSRKVSSSYSCPVCCPDSFSELRGNPGGGIVPNSGFLSVYIDGMWTDCYHNVHGPYQYPFSVNWSCSNPSVISFSAVSGNQFHANGLTVGTSSTEASAYNDVYFDDGMDCYSNYIPFYDPGDVTVQTCTISIQEETISPGTLPVRNPAIIRRLFAPVFEAIRNPTTCPITWSITSGPGSIVDSTHNPTVTVNGNAVGSVVLQAVVTGGAAASPLTIPVVNQTTVNVKAYIVRNTNGSGAATTQARVDQDIADSNLIWVQCGIQFTLVSTSFIDNSTYLSPNASVRPTLRNENMGTGAMEVYYVTSFSDDSATGLTTNDGIIITAVGNTRTAAHELGHALLGTTTHYGTADVSLMHGTLSSTKADISLSVCNLIMRYTSN